MKLPEAWFDQKYSHQRVMPQKDNWVILAAFFAVLVLFLQALDWCGHWTFRHQTATPSDVLIGGSGMVVCAFIAVCLAWGVRNVGRGVWRLNVRGYVLWLLVSRSGREWRVVTPRERRPRPYGLSLFALGVPLSGWWHVGQIWNGEDRKPFEVRRQRGPEFLETHRAQISDTYYKDRITVPFDRDSTQMRLLRSNLAGTWFGVLHEAQQRFEAAQEEISELRSLVAYNQASQQLQNEIATWHNAAGKHFHHLMGTSRLIFSEEGQSVTRNWQQTLLQLLPEAARQMYKDVQVPPRRRRMSKAVVGVGSGEETN